MPKFGELTAAGVWVATTRTLSDYSGVWSESSRTLSDYSGVWSATTRTLTDISMEEVMDLPIMDSLYPTTTLTSSASANVFGSWAQVSADIGTGKRLLYAVCTPASLMGNNRLEVEIGEGGSGSEAAVARFLFAVWQRSDAGYQFPVVVPLFKSLTDNARITARIRGDEGSARTFEIGLQVA